MTHCLHCIVSGRVQGVFYRTATQERAGQLGLTGWVSNLADGTVEVMACGSVERVESLHEWLWQGPPHARVSDVRCKEVEGSPPGDGFYIK